MLSSVGVVDDVDDAGFVESLDSSSPLQQQQQQQMTSLPGQQQQQYQSMMTTPALIGSHHQIHGSQTPSQLSPAASYSQLHQQPGVVQAASGTGASGSGLSPSSTPG